MYEGRVRHDLIGPGAVNAAHKAHINIIPRAYSTRPHRIRI